MKELIDRFPGFAKALAEHQVGNLETARRHYEELVAEPALTAACLHQIAMLAIQQGREESAQGLLRHVIRIDPMFVPAYGALAQLLHRSGRNAAALGTLLEQGGILQMNEHFAQAEPSYLEILKHDPLHYGAYVNLGTCLAQMHRLPEALHAFLRALELYGRLNVQVAEFHQLLQRQLVEKRLIATMISLPTGLPSGSIEKIEDAITSLGKVMTEMCCTQEAILCHRMSVHLAPGFALAHWNLSLALLAAGDFEEGWQKYEWRWHWQGFPDRLRRLPIRRWQGEPLAGKSVFVWAEQGFGDTMQFAPLVRKLALLDVSITFEVPAPLVRLLRASLPEVHVIEAVEAEGSKRPPAKPAAFDFAVAQASLPALLRLGTADLPLEQGYLHPCSATIARWTERISECGALRIGVVWAGRPKPDPRRSIPFHLLNPLFNRRSIQWFSLQVGAAQNDIPRIGNSAIQNLAPWLTDFSETAGAILRMDLVITIDSAVAHLAGGLGKKAWLLLPWIADWRWSGDADRSDWYPEMNIFRQSSEGAWKDVIENVGRALDQLK